jgi:hypothetical protein
MEFDLPVEVLTGGSIIVRADLDGPYMLEEKLDSDKWRFFTYGYTGQYGTNGPTMHDSEYIGGRLERDILATPGIYVAIVAHWNVDEDEDNAEGWAIVTLNESLNSDEALRSR